MADDDEHDHAHGFMIPLGSFLGEAISKGHDQTRMLAQVRQTEAHRFLDSLNAEQCLALRRILCLDNESATNNYFDGQLVTLLRVVHKRDSDTGEPVVEDASSLDVAPVE